MNWEEECRRWCADSSKTDIDSESTKIELQECCIAVYLKIDDKEIVICKISILPNESNTDTHIKILIKSWRIWKTELE